MKRSGFIPAAFLFKQKAIEGGFDGFNTFTTICKEGQHIRLNEFDAV